MPVVRDCVVQHSKIDRGWQSWVTSDWVELAAGLAMSASHLKRPSAMKMRFVAKGQKETCRLDRRSPFPVPLFGGALATARSLNHHRGSRVADRFAGDSAGHLT
jgi:hypothetical protein